MKNDEENKVDDLSVGGYLFLSAEDAESARADLAKIKLLDARIRQDHPAEMKAIYEKAIESKIFKTPVGWDYLHGLRDKLLENGFSDEELIAIPLGISVIRHKVSDDISGDLIINPEKKDGGADFKKVFPIVLDIFLFILVIVMFMITYFGESDNIINYKRNVTNRYASWEESLTERERAVRKKEKELGIQDNTDFIEEPEETEGSGE